MAGAVDGHVRAGNVHRVVRAQQRQVVCQRRLRPQVRVGGAGGGQGDGFLQGLQGNEAVAGNFRQRQFGDPQLAFCIDDRGLGEVEARLRFLHVGDGGQTHFEALLGLIELAPDRFVFGTGEA